MYTSRLIPNVIRGVVGGGSELVSSVKRYNNQSSSLQSQLQPYRSNQIWTSSIQPNSSNHQSKLGLSSSLSQIISAQKFDLSTTSRNSFLQVAHNENNHAYTIMQSLPAYTQSILSVNNVENLFSPIDITKCPPPLPNINWSAVEIPSMIGSFVLLSKESRSNKSNISSEQYIPLVDAIVKNVNKLSTDQMKEILAALTLWENIEDPTSRNFCELWNAIDRECVKRARHMKVEDNFMIGDLFFQLKLARLCSYTRAMLIALGHKLPQLQAHHIVQYGFHLNLSRSNPGNVSHLQYEKAITEVINKISLEELGVIAMGLFKSQTFIQSDELCEAVFKRLLSVDLSNTSSISIASIFKLLRKSIKTHQSDRVYALLNHIAPALKRFSLLAQLQIALVGCECLVFHPKVLNDIAENFSQNVSSLRLKDIERMVLVLMLFNFIPHKQGNILHIFADELRSPTRINEISQYPKSFLSCITYMTTMGFMPEDLISTALQPSIVNSLQTSVNYTDIGREILELDYTVELELPHYKGNKLGKQMRENLGGKFFSRFKLPKQDSAKRKGFLTHQERLIVEVEEKLLALLGVEDSVVTAYALPHITAPDIIFCTDSNGIPVQIPRSYHMYRRTDFKYPLATDFNCGMLKWNAIVIGGRNNFIRGSSRLRGQTQMKIRQLQTLGYTVTLLPFMDFSKKSVRRKLEVLDNLLTSNRILNFDEERISESYARIRQKQSSKEKSIFEINF